MYQPFNWVILQIHNDEETYYKVLGQIDVGLSGWRINSGITKVESSDTHFFFHGATGSIYHCDKSEEGLSPTTDNILKRMIENGTAELEVVPAENILEEHLLEA